MSDDNKMVLFSGKEVSLGGFNGEISIPDGVTVMDYVASVVSGRLPQLKIGQLGSTENGGIYAGAVGHPSMPAPKFFTVLKKSGGTKVFSKAFAGPLTVIPIGVADSPERTYFDKPYNEVVPDQKPACHSINYLQADLKFIGATLPGGVIAGQCCKVSVKMRNGSPVVDADGNAILEFKDFCPLSIGKTDDKGNFKPGACQKQIVIAIAIIDPDSDSGWSLVEARFKSISYAAGLAASGYLRNIQKRGGEVSLYNAVLTAINKSQGNSYKIDVSREPVERDPELETVLYEFSERWKDSLAWRAKQADSLEDEDDENTENDNPPVIEKKSIEDLFS